MKVTVPPPMVPQLQTKTNCSPSYHKTLWCFGNVHGAIASEWVMHYDRVVFHCLGQTPSSTMREGERPFSDEAPAAERMEVFVWTSHLIHTVHFDHRDSRRQEGQSAVKVSSLLCWGFDCIPHMTIILNVTADLANVLQIRVIGLNRRSI